MRSCAYVCSLVNACSLATSVPVVDSEGFVHIVGDPSVALGTINTYIVGREFSMVTVCEEGMPLAFVRDADNPKESNAFKVGTVTFLAFMCV